MSIKKKMKKFTKGAFSDNKFREIKLPIVENSSSKERLEYLNERMEIDISLETAVNQYKLVTDLRELFRLNSWLEMTEDKSKMKDLAEEGIGFLSRDNSIIIFRDMYGDWNKRYQNYNLYNNVSHMSSTLYSIGKDIEVVSNPSINIAEGVFDIIGVHEAIDNSSNDIFLGVSGKSFGAGINRIHALGFLDSNINIYSDNDVKPAFYKKLKKGNRLLKYAKMIVYYNTIQDDFGVPSNQIKTRRVII